MSFERAAELAGFMSSHAVWSVSSGGPLVPILAYEKGDERQLIRLVVDDSAEAARQGEEWLASNPESADRAVFIMDAYVRIEGERHDALIIQIVDFAAPRTTLEVLITYRPADGAEGFAVDTPRFGNRENITDVQKVADAYFRGVDAHEEAAKVWNAEPS